MLCTLELEEAALNCKPRTPTSCTIIRIPFWEERPLLSSMSFSNLAATVFSNLAATVLKAISARLISRQSGMTEKATTRRERPRNCPINVYPSERTPPSRVVAVLITFVPCPPDH